MKNITKFISELAEITRGFGFLFAFRYFFLTLKALPKVLRTGSLGPVDKLITCRLQVKKWGYVFEFEPDAIPLIRELILHNCYGFDTSRNYNTIIDLGANRGVFTAIAAKKAKQVICVECDSKSMPEKFARTMEMNNIQNAVFINKFASSVTQDNTVSLNYIVKELNLREISFLKIDIEGAEKELFSKNLEWLSVTNEISMEVHPCFGVDTDELLSILKRHGFRCTLLNKDFWPVSELASESMGYIRAQKA